MPKNDQTAATLAHYQPIIPLPLNDRESIDHLERLRARLTAATLADEVNDALAAYARARGLRMIGYLAFHPPAPREYFAWFAPGVGAGFTDAYLEQGMSTLDPATQRCKSVVFPVPWGLTIHRRRAIRSHRRIYGLLDDFRLFRGMAIPIHGPGWFALLGITVDDSEGSLLRRLDGLAWELIQAAAYAHDTALRLFAHQATAPQATLSAREQECLAWSAAGLSAREIADRLNVAESTAVFHLNNAKRKLGARTLVQAVAIAMSRNLFAL